MIDSRLFKALGSEKYYLIPLVALKYYALFLNLALIYCLSKFLSDLALYTKMRSDLIIVCIVLIGGWIIQLKLTAHYKLLISQGVKQTMREKLYKKLYHFGLNYTQHARPSDVVQLSVQGIEQLDIYYGSFLPQLIYALTAPCLLLAILAQIHLKTALILFLGVPFIPLSIAVFQRLTKRVMNRYWGSYLDLSDVFLKFLSAMTTLKVYNTDAYENKRLNDYAEDFRKNTMRLLYVQLNNITIMDIIGYGGAAIGMVLALKAYQMGEIKLLGLLVFILASSEMFLPLRALGSLFHVAMNGMSAVKQLFKIFDLKKDEPQAIALPDSELTVNLTNVAFSYCQRNDILRNIDMVLPYGKLVSIVGQSGSGKSTIAALIAGALTTTSGQISFNKTEIPASQRMAYVTLIDNQPYFFEGSLRYNLCIARQDATDKMLWQVLEKVNLKRYFKSDKGLDTLLLSGGANLSGGQRQRLAVARALLKDSPIYLFDEATSNIDSDSEAVILNVIDHLKTNKTVLFISHRLKHTTRADYIYYLKEGAVVEHGICEALLNKQGEFYKLYSQQMSLENWQVSP